MGKNNLKIPWSCFLLVIILGGLIASSGCGGSSSGDDGEYDDSPEYPEPYSLETVIGPEGGVIEVTDTGSSIYGFKIEIPEGALNSSATIIVSEVSGAPSLPAGLINSNPIIELSADAPFLKEIKIIFPLQSTADNNEKIISAFYYDTDSSKWRIAIPGSVNDNTMTVSTQHFSYWGWGEVLPDEVEIETLELLLDDTFGTGYVGKLETAMDMEFQPLFNGTLNYCDNRSEFLNFLEVTAENAKIPAEDYLQIVNNTCNIGAWDSNPTISDIFYGIDELAEMNYDFWETVIIPDVWDLVPIIGEIKGYVETIQALALLERRQEQLKDEYRCIFKNADSELWINIGIYYAAYSARYGIPLAEIFEYFTCTP